MKRLDSDKMVYVDCDDTLVMWDLSRYRDALRAEDLITLDCWGPVVLYINQKNVNLVRKLKLLGHTVVVWSQTGSVWAETVAKAVGLDDVASLYLTKPKYYVDDLPSNAWCGERIWRDPVSGASAPDVRRIDAVISAESAEEE